MCRKHIVVDDCTTQPAKICTTIRAMHLIASLTLLNVNSTRRTRFGMLTEIFCALFVHTSNSIFVFLTCTTGMSVGMVVTEFSATFRAVYNWRNWLWPFLGADRCVGDCGGVVGAMPFTADWFLSCGTPDCCISIWKILGWSHLGHRRHWSPWIASNLNLTNFW